MHSLQIPVDNLNEKGYKRCEKFENWFLWNEHFGVFEWQ